MTSEYQPLSGPEFEIQSLRDMLDALMVRADKATLGDGLTTEFRVVSAEMDLAHKLAEARDALDALATAVHADSVERTKIPTRMCRCKGDDYTDISLCPIHTINHPHKEGCCDGEEDAHRHMTSSEYKAAYPLIFDAQFTVDGTTYRVDSRRFSTGDGVTLTRLFPKSAGENNEDDDDYGGLCFDFRREIVPDLIRVLQLLDATHG